MAPCLQGQHRPSAQVKVTWRFDAPDSTAMSTPRHSSSSAAFTQLRCLHDDFDAALEPTPVRVRDHESLISGSIPRRVVADLAAGWRGQGFTGRRGNEGCAVTVTDQAPRRHCVVIGPPQRITEFREAAGGPAGATTRRSPAKRRRPHPPLGADSWEREPASCRTGYS
jgi:hypothetical protein